MELRNKIYNALGTHFKGEQETEKILTEVVGKTAKCYDTSIDDGVDDCENTYVMKSCFSFVGSNLIVRIYYGDITKEIGYIGTENLPMSKN